MKQEPLRRGPWSQREDDILRDLVHSQGALNWVKISHQIGTRSPKQCRERYHQNLKPFLNHNPITPEEGAHIEMMVDRIGKRWAEIARSLDNRSDNAVKNWWNGSMNRRKRLARREAHSAPGQHNNFSHYYSPVPEQHHEVLPPETAPPSLPTGRPLPPPLPLPTPDSTALAERPPLQQSRLPVISALSPRPRHYDPAPFSSSTSHHRHGSQDFHDPRRAHRPLQSRHYSLQSPSWNSYSGLPSPSVASPRPEPVDPPIKWPDLGLFASRFLPKPSITLPRLRIDSRDPLSPLKPELASPVIGAKYEGPRLPSIGECMDGRIRSQLPTAPSSPYQYSPSSSLPLATSRPSTWESEQSPIGSSMRSISPGNHSPRPPSPTVQASPSKGKGPRRGLSIHDLIS
ncbi:hypothetical protein F5Y05DRAFT_252824 [Hypoxylon sp. FL0543]|nr:hypothetical protein F5Y05DRAFT_252824 [Hypoxylon sp. FL0543]